MTISFVGAGTAQTSDGSASMLVPPHASAAEGDLHILLVSWRRVGTQADTDRIPRIDGWNILAFNTGGQSSVALYQYAYYRIGTPEDVKVPLLNFPAAAGAAVQLHYSSDEEFWSVESSWGDDTSFGSNYSATGSGFTDVRPVAGDVVVAFTTLESTAGTITNDALSQSGLTFGTVTLRADESQSTDLRIRAVDAPVNSGTTAVDTTYTHSNASSNSGGTIFLRITDFDLSPGEIFHRTSDPLATSNSGGTGLTVAAPFFQDSNNLHIAYIGLKPFSAIPEPALGWTLLAVETNGTTASGNDTGSVKVVVYYKFGILTETEETTVGDGPFITFPVDTNTVWMATIHSYFGHPSTPWAVPTAQVGSDSTHGANYSATGGGQLGAVAGDVVQAFTFLNSDAGTPSSLSLSISGLTLGSLTTVANTDTTSGHDAAFILVEAEVSSGTEAGAPVFTFSNASSTSGSTVFILLHLNPEITFTAAEPASGFSTDNGRYLLTATNVFPHYDTFSIVRVSETGNYQPEFVAADRFQETPLEISDWAFHYAAVDSNDEETFHYQLDLYIGTNKVGEVTSNSVTPHTSRTSDPNYDATKAPGTFIKSLTDDVCWPVTIGDFDGYETQGRTLGEYDILGNPFPVVVTDVMSATRGRFTILIYDNPQHVGSDGVISTIKQLRDLFASGQPLFFQTVWPWMSGIYDFHFVVRNYTVNRLNRVVILEDDDASSPVFEVDVSFIETEIVEEQGVLAPLTWESLSLDYGFWGNMSAANTTWLDVLNDG